MHALVRLWCSHAATQLTRLLTLFLLVLQQLSRTLLIRLQAELVTGPLLLARSLVEQWTSTNVLQETTLAVCGNALVRLCLDLFGQRTIANESVMESGSFARLGGAAFTEINAASSQGRYVLP